MLCLIFYLIYFRIFNLPQVHLYNNSKFIPEFNFEVVDVPYSWFDIANLQKTRLERFVIILICLK